MEQKLDCGIRALCCRTDYNFHFNSLLQRARNYSKSGSVFWLELHAPFSTYGKTHFDRQPTIFSQYAIFPFRSCEMLAVLLFEFVCVCHRGFGSVHNRTALIIANERFLPCGRLHTHTHTLAYLPSCGENTHHEKIQNGNGKFPFNEP